MVMNSRRLGEEDTNSRMEELHSSLCSFSVENQSSRSEPSETLSKIPTALKSVRLAPKSVQSAR